MISARHWNNSEQQIVMYLIHRIDDDGYQRFRRKSANCSAGVVTLPTGPLERTMTGGFLQKQAAIQSIGL
jgi:hypothetical protein